VDNAVLCARNTDSQGSVAEGHCVKTVGQASVDAGNVGLRGDSGWLRGDNSRLAGYGGGLACYNAIAVCLRQEMGVWVVVQWNGCCRGGRHGGLSCGQSGEGEGDECVLHLVVSGGEGELDASGLIKIILVEQD